MRRRLVARLLTAASEVIGTTAGAQVTLRTASAGPLCSGAAAATCAARAVSASAVAQLQQGRASSTLMREAPAAAAEPAFAEPAFSDPGPEEPALPVDDVDVSAAGRHQATIPASQVPAFLRAHITGVTSEELISIVDQLIDLHFAEAEEDSSRRSELAGTMSEIIRAVVHKPGDLRSACPLRRDGEVVSRLLWGAYRLDLGEGDMDWKALMEAVEDSLDSCSDNGIAVAHALCALGGHHLHPSKAYLERVGSRLTRENMAQNMHPDYLILALQGVALLQFVPPTVLNTLLAQLLKSANLEGLDAVYIARIARFVPDLPQSANRDALEAQLYAQAAEAVPFMDIFGVNLLLRCAARTGARLDRSLLEVLVQRALLQLGDESGVFVAGSLLWALGKQGLRLGDGVVSEGFVKACADTHLATIEHLRQRDLRIPFRVPFRGAPISQALVDFLEGCVLLHVRPAEAELRACVTLLKERGLEFGFHEAELESLRGSFEALGFAPGVETCAELQE